MKFVVLYLFTALLFLGCKKEQGPKVDIYLLKSFTTVTNQSTNPVTLSITNAVLADTPLVADRDIRLYIQSSSTFKLKKNIKPVIQNFGPDKAFAVTVDKQPVYFGRFHPAYMSSLVFGLATIDPILGGDNELQLHYVTMDGSAELQLLDKRADSRIIYALKASGRLR